MLQKGEIMRVITGKYRGRRLESPWNDETRPTSDKVKEALFSILQMDIDGAVFCDVFAGSGGIGIEALSRGAQECYFIEASNEACKLLSGNIKKCEIEEPYQVLKGDFRAGLNRIGKKIDILFMDPPYENDLEIEALEIIASEEIMSENGIIVVEHSNHTVLPEEIGRFSKYKSKKYGKIALSFYE
ncbi:MAG: 16S rRNA (guanine(966)-N(2))-methyltransferase RsmD [Eubacteriales bacterium]|nr:16S rRNA (guanine(966)-N(2))-methyltransferase RsmD [Eubacteriales bacterium]